MQRVSLDEKRTPRADHLTEMTFQRKRTYYLQTIICHVNPII